MPGRIIDCTLHSTMAAVYCMMQGLVNRSVWWGGGHRRPPVHPVCTHRPHGEPMCDVLPHVLWALTRCTACGASLSRAVVLLSTACPAALGLHAVALAFHVRRAHNNCKASTAPVPISLCHLCAFCARRAVTLAALDSSVSRASLCLPVPVLTGAAAVISGCDPISGPGAAHTVFTHKVCWGWRVKAVHAGRCRVHHVHVPHCTRSVPALTASCSNKPQQQATAQSAALVPWPSECGRAAAHSTAFTSHSFSTLFTPSHLTLSRARLQVLELEGLTGDHVSLGQEELVRTAGLCTAGLCTALVLLGIARTA